MTVLPFLFRLFCKVTLINASSQLVPPSVPHLKSLFIIISSSRLVNGGLSLVTVRKAMRLPQ